MPKTIGQRIREIRRKRGITIVMLSERTGYDTGFLSRVETGKRGTSADVLIRLAPALNENTIDMLKMAGHEIYTGK